MKRVCRGLFIAAMIGCIVCLLILRGYYTEYQKGSKEYTNLAENAVYITRKTQAESGNETNDLAQAEKTETPPALFIDFEYLQSVNSDIVGWIDFPGQDISYPVVLGNDNDYYLRHTFRNTDNFAGSIFADCRNSGLFTDDNTIIYGHNMKNGSMFGKLKQYAEQEHYNQYPYFDIYTPETVYRCRIFSACRIRADMSNYPVDFADAGEKKRFMQTMETQCAYKTSGAQTAQPENTEEEETGASLVMLSTCVGNRHDYRWILLAEAKESAPPLFIVPDVVQ